MKQLASIIQSIYHSVSRRDFLKKISWSGIIIFLAGSAVATVRFFFPRVSFEAPTRFNVGKSTDFPVGMVSTAFEDKYRLWIVCRDDGSFLVLSAICTHLGCTANWKSSEKIIHCPCHGSKFDLNGTNFAGPAPRPLDRFKISQSSEGELVVDTSVIYKGVAGKDSDELYPQSLLRV